MAFRRKPLSPGLTKQPDHYDDPLGVDEILPAGQPIYAPQVAIVTGLSDEEDARREIAKRFNPAMKFCPNCETYTERSGEPSVQNNYHWCDYCGDNLREVGVSPRKKKFNQR